MPETTFPATDDGLLAALHALGDAADQVAATLHAGGWRGVRGHCNRCPVAVCLEATFPGYGALVDVDNVKLYPVGDGDDGRVLEAHMPSPVEHFAYRFDTDLNAYPALATGTITVPAGGGA